MKNTLALKWARNPLLAVLLLVAFCARALVPAGFMPGAGGLVFCQGLSASQDARAVPMSHDMSTMDMSGPTHADSLPDHHDRPTGDHEGSSVCPFAAAITSMASGHAPAPDIAIAAESGSASLPDLAFVPRGTIVPTRLPRGPPVLV